MLGDEAAVGCNDLVGGGVDSVGKGVIGRKVGTDVVGVDSIRYRVIGVVTLGV